MKLSAFSAEGLMQLQLDAEEKSVCPYKTSLPKGALLAITASF